MSGNYQYQEFPKWKYHPKHEALIARNAEEERALGRGWVNTPNELPKPSRIRQTVPRVKAWWNEWEWSFTAITKVVGALTAAGGVVVMIYRLFR